MDKYFIALPGFAVLGILKLLVLILISTIMGSETKRRQNLYQNLAQIYRKDIFDGQEEYYNWYRQASSLKEAIAKAITSEDKNRKLHSHQHLVGRKVLALAKEKAREIYRNDYLGKNLDTFDEIYSFVNSACGEIYNFGELAHYDVSLRIAKYQDTKYPNCSYLPDVYLHNGTLEGAKAIFQAGDLQGIKRSDLQSGKKIEVKYFPSPLNELSGDHLENLLCIYKQDLKEQKILNYQKGCGSLSYKSLSCIKSSSSL